MEERGIEHIVNITVTAGVDVFKTTECSASRMALGTEPQIEFSEDNYSDFWTASHWR